MKYPNVVTACFLLLLINAPSAFADSHRSQPDWANTEIIRINTEPLRATFIPFSDRETAIREVNEAKRSSRYRTLSGEWAFYWSASPAERPVDFWKTDFSDQTWSPIEVPSMWQMEGFGLPNYVNFGYPFPKDEFKVPMDWNPVGSYRKTFHLPETWRGDPEDGDQVFLHFEGVSSAFYVWINGKKVGYSQGSRTPAEFDVTEFLQAGRNLIAVEVYRYSDASYLEDQDFWRLSGIFRDVYLWKAKAVALKNFQVLADYDPESGSAILGLEAMVSPETDKVRVELLDTQSREVYLDRTISSRSTVVALDPVELGLEPWSAEYPNLYTLVLSQMDAGGVVHETVAQNIGFRRIEIRDGIFLVNGAAIKLRGVNRHEAHPETGQVVDRGSMMRDIVLLKQNNFNAVRTAHYPNVTEWYSLCDRYGIYLINEANLETHGFGRQDFSRIAMDPVWKEQHVDRIQRVVERDINHPSVLMWSLGNEASAGDNLHAMYLWAKERDPSRPIHYENSTHQDGRGISTDLISRMYLPARAFQGRLDRYPDKPMVWCEYTHAMGNSNGGLDAYWDVIWSEPRVAGAFVWDWMDQGIQVRIPHGLKDPWGRRDFFAYGGWWEDRLNIFNNNNFCMNGLIAADWTPHPGLKALKYVMQPVKVTLSDDGKSLLVLNRYDFTNLQDHCILVWSLSEEGKLVDSGQLEMPSVAPGEWVEMPLPAGALQTGSEKEHWLMIRFLGAEASPFWERGHELAFTQFKVAGDWKPSGLSRSGILDSSESEKTIGIMGADFELIFDKEAMTVQSWIVDGVEMIESGPRPDFWRAPTDNDRGAGLADSFRAPNPNKILGRSSLWKGAGNSLKMDNYSISENPDRFEVVFDGTLLNGRAKLSMRYAVHASGQLDVDFEYTTEEKLPLIPRVGTQWQLPVGMDQLAWYGRGPEPTYSDRKWEPVGVFQTALMDDWLDYSKPQENGNKVDVRWFRVTGSDGRGLLFMAQDTFLSCNALPWGHNDIDQKDYSWQLPQPQRVYLNIDHAQMGVGGDDSWGEIALPQYRLHKDTYQFAYSVRPVRP